MPDPDEKNDLLGVTEMKGLKKRFRTLPGIPLKKLKKGNGLVWLPTEIGCSLCVGPFLVGMPGLEVRQEVMLQLEVQLTDPAPEAGVLNKNLWYNHLFLP
jgi:hypothetical protein